MKIENLMSRSTVRGFEARAGLESFGAMLCKMWGLPPITITWGPISTACIDAQGNATLADIADDATVTRTEVARYAGFLLHELLHRRYTDFNARDGRPYVNRLHNAIEDAWIEYRCIREGLTGNARGLLHQLIRGMVDDVPATVDWSAIAQYPFSLAVYLRQYGVTVPVPASLMPTYREALRRLPACTSSTDTLALAQWVFAQMQQQKQPEQSSKPDQQQGDQGDQPGNGQGDGQGDQTGDQQGDGKGDQQGQQQGQDGAAGDGEGADQGDTPADAGKAGKPRPDSRSREVEPQGPAPKGDTGGTFTAQANEAGWPASQQARSLDVTIPGGLRYQVRRLFENTAQDWVEPGYRSGRLNPGALHRVPNGGEDVFTRRFERDGIDSAAVLLLDMSGSMWSDLDNNVSKIDTAAACTWALAETLMQAGVDVAILGFDNDLYRLRDFGSTPALKTRATLERIRTGGSTNDYAAIRLAHQMLLRHHATRRVAFVLGDGVGDRANAARQVQQGENLGISTIGIGIGYDVRSVYGAGSVRVDRPADLGRVAFQKMKGAA
jgi:hypothetical protein